MSTPDTSYRRNKDNWNAPFELPIEEVRSLYESGLSMKAIGQHFSVNAMVVHKNMKKHGIPVRTRGGRVMGPAHHAWKGEDATYGSMHERLECRYGKPNRCDGCGTTDPSKTYDWANVTGNYADVEDYKRLCRSCHRRFDIGKRSSGFVPPAPVPPRTRSAQ